MFARTKRLTLRPAWPEDAAALTQAIGHESVARMLARVPYPYGPAEAEAFLALPRGPHDARFLIVSHEAETPDLVGGIGITVDDGGAQLGYWLKPDAWGRGYATEAGRVVIDMARHALPLRKIGAWHFIDNPASGRVLRKLGFRPTGTVMTRPSLGRPEEAASAAYELDLGSGQNLPMPMAA